MVWTWIFSEKGSIVIRGALLHGQPHFQTSTFRNQKLCQRVERTQEFLFYKFWYGLIFSQE
uniref:Uncharacterized protein n=1 Tax=Rhizophora mucronata TaxID=61149 RepID=A0A2P2IJJ4_RHIMU